MNWGDARSGKVAFVAHCILNHNAKVHGLASKPCMDKRVIEVLEKNGYGIAQLPCPETTMHGLRRWWQVREQYDTPGFREHCRRILQPTMLLMAEFQRAGYSMIIIGVEGSPSCGVRFSGSSLEWLGQPRMSGSEYPIERGPGVFMSVLIDEIKRWGLQQPRMTGFAAYLPGYTEDKAIKELEEFLSAEENSA